MLNELIKINNILSQTQLTKGKYALIGGLAVSIWSNPRATKDIDLLIMSSTENNQIIADILNQNGINAQYIKSDITDPLPNIIKAEINKVNIDIICASKTWEEEAIFDVSIYKINDKLVLPIISPEYLIIMKLKANGPKDLLDVTELITAGTLNIVKLDKLTHKHKVSKRLDRLLTKSNNTLGGIKEMKTNINETYIFTAPKETGFGMVYPDLKFMGEGSIENSCFTGKLWIIDDKVCKKPIKTFDATNKTNEQTWVCANDGGFSQNDDFHTIITKNLPVANIIKFQFQIGDKVDFINDYGVSFPGKFITGIEFIEGKKCYHITPTDTPWNPTEESKLIPTIFEKDLHEYGHFVHTIDKLYFHKQNEVLKKLCQLSFDLDKNYKKMQKTPNINNELCIKNHSIQSEIKNIIENNFPEIKMQFIYNSEKAIADVKLLILNQNNNEISTENYFIPKIPIMERTANKQKTTNKEANNSL